MKFKLVLFISFLGSFAFAKNPCATVSHSIPEYDHMTHAFKGCKLKANESGSVYAQLGFKVGDVVNPEPSKSIKIKNSKDKLDTDSH